MMDIAIQRRLRDSEHLADFLEAQLLGLIKLADQLLLLLAEFLGSASKSSASSGS